MSYSKLILRDYADIVWPLDDITSSASLSNSINFFYPNPLSYSACVNIYSTRVQNIPMIYGGGSLLQFTSSAVGLSIPAIGRFSNLYKDKNSVMSFWLKVDSISSEEQVIFKKRGSSNIGLFIKNDYLIFKFGNSASFSQVIGNIKDLNEPHHIVVAAGQGYRSLIIDGNERREIILNDEFPLYSSSASLNDYIDFYGPKNGFWEIDCPAFYPNLISSNVAKRHYVYGLGKSVDNSVFFSRGGNLYNFTTIETEKASEISWDYPEEWKLSSFTDLEADDSGIKPLSLTAPKLLSFDNNITKQYDSIMFSSASNTFTSYIDILGLSTKILDGSHPFFFKFTLNGKLPINQLHQRLVSYGTIPDSEILNIDLFNDNNEYKIRFTANGFSGSATFNISNISSSPTIYVGVGFSGQSKFYFCESGSAIQTASFSYISASGYGLDPLISFFPPAPNTIIRIGGTLVYDLESTIPSTPFDFYQYQGTFNKFLVVNSLDISSILTFSSLEKYKKHRYSFYYSTLEDRFLVSTYGKGSFNLHAIDISEYIDSNTLKIGSNIIEIGYPDIISASNVVFNLTHYSYTGSVLHSTQRLNKKNFINYLNNVNLAETYLKFDFEIYTNDLLFYPPKIKYFHMETYKENNKRTMLRDDAGVPYFLYPDSSSTVYLPETRLTPTIFLRDDSGLKLKGTQVDLSEKIFPVPLDPRDILGLTLWLDSRYPLGIRKFKFSDDSRVNQLIDLSGNDLHAYQAQVLSQPVYRIQSLNMFTYSQLSGSEPNDLTNIIPFNANLESSAYGAITGTKAVSIIPNGTSTDSYIDLGYNTASITIFPDQQYTVVGTIKLNKRQTASALHQNARKIIIYTTNGVTETLSGSSIAATNSAGTYSLSAKFTTNSSTTGAKILFYNGSYSQDDVVYWDNMGLYPVSASTIYFNGQTASIQNNITEWIKPLLFNDRPTIKFDGKNMAVVSSASSNNLNSLYVVSRNFGDSVIIQSTTASILYSNSSSYFASYGVPVSFSLDNNNFNLFSILNNGNSASIFINGNFSGNYNIGSQSINQLLIGNGLKGDISAVILYNKVNSKEERERIENWLSEEFSIY